MEELAWVHITGKQVIQPVMCDLSLGSPASLATKLDGGRMSLIKIEWNCSKCKGGGQGLPACKAIFFPHFTDNSKHLKIEFLKESDSSVIFIVTVDPCFLQAGKLL